VLIAQISDCHITAPGDRVADRVDPGVGLRHAIAKINAFTPAIDLVVGTGDLVNDGRADEYDHLERLLADLAVPFLPLPGNHDDRTELRRRFDTLPSGTPTTPIDHVVDLDSCRLVCLDTTIPGRHDGRLVEPQLAWLDEVLGGAPDVTTIVAQHHPPIPSGIPSMDRFGLEGRETEAAVLARHPQVAAVIGGHFHRSIHARFATTVVSCCPSTAVQLALVFDDDQVRYGDEPPGLLLHRVDQGGVASHVIPVAPAESWIPSWAADGEPERERGGGVDHL
jgi:3',5'-cyclic AMP phosphodiesterase CpdA